MEAEERLGRAGEAVLEMAMDRLLYEPGVGDGVLACLGIGDGDFAGLGVGEGMARVA